MSLTIKALPKEERPREKYKENGFQRLSDADLIAILLRTGYKNLSVSDLALHLLKEVGSLNKLKETSLEALSKIKGIGEVKAITLLTALELGKRISTLPEKKQIKIYQAEDLYNLFSKELEQLSQEHLIAVFLNSKNKIIDYKTIFIGSANQSIAHPRDIFKEAMKNAAVKIMLIHNHPSGDPTPSKEDIIFTKRMLDAGELLQIPLIDHIIVGLNKYYSFYDHTRK